MGKCRISKEKLDTIIDLGNIYLNDFLKKKNIKAPKGKLRIGFGRKSKLVQLLDTADQDRLYKHYWYRSGTNQTMTNQLKEIVDIVPYWINLRNNDVVLDIGCNDGTLLRHYKNYGNFRRIGIDPAINVAREGKRNCEAHSISFFSKKTFIKLSKKKATVITSIAVFYDLDNPSKFVSDIYNCLDDRGIWILQLSYTPLMISLNAFDNIIHEHIEYYTLESLIPLLNKYKLEIVNAEINDVNAGSLRLIIKKKANKLPFAAHFTKEIGKLRLKSLILFEKEKQFGKKITYLNFKKRVDKQKTNLLNLLKKLKKQKKLVLGYGINESLLSAIAERQKQKVGLLTVGSWIPIISEKEMRKRKPDYLLVLPWQFIHEFIKREIKFLQGGGKFIVPLPEVKIIGNENNER